MERDDSRFAEMIRKSVERKSQRLKESLRQPTLEGVEAAHPGDKNKDVARVIA
jgi:hypothetical protein